MNGGINMNEYNEYIALIETKNCTKSYFVIFKDVKNIIQKIEVNKITFLQFFGTHKSEIINGNKRYFIVYQDNEIACYKELTKKEYITFRSFKSEFIREKHIYSRYIEHTEQSEISLYKKSIIKPKCIESQLNIKSRNNSIYEAIELLNEIQRRRIIYYYIYEMSSAEIATRENCSKAAVNYSIAIAKKN